MKYLVIALTLLMTGCLEERPTTQADVEMANCICQKRTKTNANYVTREGDMIVFECDAMNIGFRHYDKTITVGCTK